MKRTPIITNVINIKRLFCMGILCILGIALTSRNFSKSKNKYLLFCQEYPVSVCLTSSKNTCKHGSDIYSWPVHGIWATYTRRRYSLQYCRKINLDIGVLQSIEMELNTHWYSLFNDNAKFWKHEWSKHGTCALYDTPLKTELNYSYFNQGLLWNKKYPIKDILARHDIIPRDELPYSIDAIHQAFVSDLGVRVGITCKKQQIIQVRLCFSMNLQLINCYRHRWDDCDDNEVYYPKTVTKFVDS